VEDEDGLFQKDAGSSLVLEPCDREKRQEGGFEEINGGDNKEEYQKGNFLAGWHKLSLGPYYTFFCQVFVDFAAGLDDEELVIAPFAVNHSLHQARVAS